MSGKGIPYNREIDLLHPAIAEMLNTRGFDWWYEVALAGRYRVDFLAHGKYTTWILEGKIALNPKEDIPQVNFYHDLYGDPKAQKVIVTPRPAYKVYRDDVFDKYAANNITIVFIEDACIVNTWRGFAPYRVYTLYPDHIDYRPIPINVPSDVVKAIQSEYVPYKVTIQQLADKYMVSPATVYRIVQHTPEDSTPAIYIPFVENIEMEQI